MNTKKAEGVFTFAATLYCGLWLCATTTIGGIAIVRVALEALGWARP